MINNKIHKSVNSSVVMTQERLAEILTVHTVTRPNLRTDEFFVFVGQLFLIELFDTNKDMSEYKEVSLIYPERWLNILELRVLFEVVKIKCPFLEKLYIKTHSAFILQCSPKGTVFVIDHPSDYPEIKYELGVRYCPKDNYNGKLVAIGGTITTNSYIG